MNLQAATKLLAIMLLAPISLIEAGEPGGAHEMLERMSAAMSQMSYQGTFVYVQGDDVETMRITHVADESGIRERLVSISGEPSELLRDQEGVRWIKGDDQSVINDSAFGHSFFPELPPGQSEEVAQSYQLKVSGSARIAGHVGRRLNIVPNDQYRYGYSLWLEEKSAMLLKWELLGSDGGRLAKLMFTDLRLGSEVDRKELQPGTRLSDFKTLESGLPSQKSLSHTQPKWKPKVLPPGFRLTAHRNMSTDGNRVYEHLVYSDGLAAVSVYVETDSPDLNQGEQTGVSRLGTTHAFSRRGDGVLITVVGDVPAITVQFIGQAVDRSSR